MSTLLHFAGTYGPYLLIVLVVIIRIWWTTRNSRSSSNGFGTITTHAVTDFSIAPSPPAPPDYLGDFLTGIVGAFLGIAAQLLYNNLFGATSLIRDWIIIAVLTFGGWGILVLRTREKDKREKERYNQALKEYKWRQEELRKQEEMRKPSRQIARTAGKILDFLGL